MSKITFQNLGSNRYLQQIRYLNELELPNNQLKYLCDLSDLYVSIFGSNVNVCDLTQQDTFKNLLDKINNTNVSSDYVKDLYLNISSFLIEKFTKASLESIFYTKEENVDLINSIDFSGLYDLPNVIKQTQDDFENNPCILKSDFDPAKELHPFKLLILRPAVLLLIRLHILDFKLKNLLNSSVFLHTEFIDSDNTLSEYLYRSLTSKLKLDDSERGQNFYLNFVEACVRLLNEDLENNLCLVDPLTKNRLKFSKIKYDFQFNEEIENYIKYLFNLELNKSTIIFDKFFSQFFIEDTNTFNLSKKYDCYTYLFSKLSVYEPGQIVSEEDEIYFEVSKDFNNFTVTLKIKASNIATVTFQTSSTESALNLFIQNFNQITQNFKNNNFANLFLNYVFNLQKILNISSIYQYFIITNENEQINNMFLSTFESLKLIIKTNLINRKYNEFDKELDCPLDLDFELNGLDIKSQFNLDVLKLAATTPIKIFKGLVESTDPNISLANKIRTIAESAGAPKSPIIPYSLGLLPAGLVPPPIGIGPPILPPYGYIYWAIDAAEVIYDYSNDKTVNSRNKLQVKQLENNSGISSLTDLLPEECR